MKVSAFVRSSWILNEVNIETVCDYLCFDKELIVTFPNTKSVKNDIKQFFKYLLANKAYSNIAM